jgi:hypothetical protein
MTGLDHADERALAKATVTIRTAGGHKVVLDDRTQTVTITHSGGTAVTLTPAGVEIRGTAHVTVAAPMVTVDAGMAQFSGVVKCDTLIANSVVSASYTPGAGNIW